MTANQAYEKHLLLAEANGTTDGLATDKGRFAVKYNLAQNKIVEWFIENNKSDENRYIQVLKIPYKKLIERSKEDYYTEFDFPKDYFEFSDLRVYATKDSCKDKVLKTKEVKMENVSNLLTDPFSNPSFKYLESFYTLASNQVQIYKDDFEVSKAEMSYYRYPKQIQLETPDNPESNFQTGELEFDDKLINRIILSTVALHELSSDDPKYQLFKQETIQKF